MVSTYLSRRYLKENLSKKSVQGILISLLGALLIVIHAPRQETSGTVSSILSNTSIYFQVYFTSLLIFTSITAYKLKVEDDKKSSDTEIQKNIALFATLQTCTLGTIGVMCTKLMTMISVDSFHVLYLGKFTFNARICYQYSNLLFSGVSWNRSNSTNASLLRERCFKVRKSIKSNSNKIRGDKRFDSYRLNFTVQRVGHVIESRHNWNAHWADNSNTWYNFGGQGVTQ